VEFYIFGLKFCFCVGEERMSGENADRGKQIWATQP